MNVYFKIYSLLICLLSLYMTRVDGWECRTRVGEPPLAEQTSAETAPITAEISSLRYAH